MDFAQLVIDIILFLVYSFGFILVMVYVFRFWMLYVNQKFLNKMNQDTIMLEILLPREIFKSPMAFELVATAFTQGGGVGNAFNRIWQGALPVQFSLEIASLEGVVHFYIRTHKKFKPLIESNIYAQYPGIEVVEVEDYTLKFPRHHHLSPDTSMWGNSFNLKEEFIVQKKDDTATPPVKEVKMPGDYLTIRTYIDMGLDKDPKEEFKNDPLSQVIEFLGSLGKGQYAGFQILLQDASNFDDKKFPATYVNPVDHKHLKLEEVAKMRIDQIRKKTIKAGTLVEDDYGGPKWIDGPEKDAEGKPIKVQAKYLKDKVTDIPEMQLTPELKDEIEEIHRKLSKPILRCVARVIYVTKNANFNPGHINNCISLLKPFSYTGFNTFGGKTFADPYGYPWQDTRKRRKPWRREEIFDAYIEREGFHLHTGVLDLGTWGDLFFFPYPGYVRRTAHMILESLLHPFSHPPTNEVFSLNIEELATLYHFPGRTAATPSLPRIDSVKGVAPTNLPQ